MQKEFVTYEIAKKLKELGFNEPCLGYFDRETQEFHWTIAGSLNHEDGDELEYNCISAPLWQQAIDWLAEKHKIAISPNLQLINDNSFSVYQLNTLGRTFEFCSINKETAVLKTIELLIKK